MDPAGFTDAIANIVTFPILTLGILVAPERFYAKDTKRNGVRLA